VEIQLIRGDDGLLAKATVRQLFLECVRANPALGHDREAYRAFRCGLRCLERLLVEVGVEASLHLNGVTVGAKS